MTFGQLERICLGGMGMRRDDYQDETIGQLITRITGFYEIEDMRNREAWERCRWSTAVLLNIQLPKKDRIQAHKLLPLPWDDQTPNLRRSRKLTPEEEAEIFGKIDKLMQNRKNGSISGTNSTNRSGNKPPAKGAKNSGTRPSNLR